MEDESRFQEEVVVVVVDITGGLLLVVSWILAAAVDEARCADRGGEVIKV